LNWQVTELEDLVRQRLISRFGLMARADGTWLANPARHWNIDRPDPR
jgi:hypothetical protein